MSGREYLVEFVKKVSGTSKPRQIIIPYYLLDICGDDYGAAALLNQVLFWMDITKHPSKWYARSYEDIQKELRLSKFQVMRAAKVLEKLGVETKSMISRYHKFARVIHWRMTDKALETMLKKSIDDGVLTSWSEETQLHDGLSNQETQLHRVKKLDGLIDKSIRKDKREILAPAFADRGEADLSHTHNIANEADDMSMFPLQGKKPARAEKRPTPAQTPSPSLKPKTDASSIGELPPTPPIAAAPPLPQAVSAPVLEDSGEKAIEVAATLEGKKTPKRSEKQMANDARIEALRVALAVGRGKEPIALQGREISNYSKVANELVDGGVLIEDFLAYVEYWNKAAQGWPGGLTLNSLIKPGRITDFKTWYKTRKKPVLSDSDGTQVSTTTTSVKRGYDPRTDPAYAYLYDNPEGVKQAK